ncbi:carbohydrate ABC transporter permease [Murimonas intestini]|uniref:Carbohydrate ABC transporter membrane protein 2 (CUT1 family) n=1 Tax=Murimonas intestini TaxID=1337051 RepID=A0AB73T2G2_9FIRM|nr:carbohydrate ABC transporter permease [Murimonas intestini]MCR1841728.1 carbohydrate ABC transporter permease [Murimonas intestini]MCR1865545.1 carbohydrate ABC transporter permease [Murimonas intestini]MCR1883874.1 carbohydrate ABC transporter permease [Murimonas intestini]
MNAKRIKRRKLKRPGPGKIIVSVILVIYSFLAIFLIGNTILSSFKTKSDLINNTIGWPREFTLENFRIVLVDDGFLRCLFNSVFLVGISLLLLIAVSSMTAYGLAQYRFKGRAALQTYFLVGLMFPIQLGILPLYIMLSRAHLTNNLFGLALIYTANMSFPVFVFTKFFNELPIEVIESARVDGAGEFQIFGRIIAPISKPVIATVALLNFVTIWNDFYMPLVFLTKSSVKTLTLGVYTYTANFLANWNKVFAAATVALIPVIIVYLLFSDQIVAGLTGGAVKG